MIHEMLTNPIYTGDLVQGRRRVKSYKVHQIEAVPEDEWVRVPDTHEAIIPHETFDKVQALLVRDTWTSPKGREVHLFSGFLKCADCGKSITRSQSGKNIYYENGDKAFSCFRHDDGGDLCENGRFRGGLNETSG